MVCACDIRDWWATFLGPPVPGAGPSIAALPAIGVPDGTLIIAALRDVTPGPLFAVLVRGALRRPERLFRLAALGHASAVNVDLPVAPHVIDKSAGRLRAVKEPWRRLSRAHDRIVTCEVMNGGPIRPVHVAWRSELDRSQPATARAWADWGHEFAALSKLSWRAGLATWGQCGAALRPLIGQPSSPPAALNSMAIDGA